MGLVRRRLELDHLLMANYISLGPVMFGSIRLLARVVLVYLFLELLLD